MFGKRYISKSARTFFVGVDLIEAIDKTLEELPKPTRPTLANLGGHVLYRLTRLGLLALLLALIPIWLLWQQNVKIDIQNERINIQNHLIEAERRSSLVFLMSNILDKVDNEISEQRTQKDSIFSLSPPLINRIVALSRAFQPYQKLKEDTLSNKLISPERGQLFVSLMGIQLDSITQNTIVEKGNFENAVIKDISLKYKKFRLANLDGADFEKGILDSTNLSGASIEEANFYNAELNYINFEHTILDGSNLHYAKLNHAFLERTWLNNANLEKATLTGAYLKRAQLKNANLVGAILKNAMLLLANLEGADLSGANLKFANFTDAKLDYAIFKWTSFKDAILVNASFRHSNLNGVKSLTKEQLLTAGCLFESIGPDPELKSQLIKERPCLFTIDGCNGSR